MARTRRRVLQFGTLATCTALAGCMSGISDPSASNDGPHDVEGHEVLVDNDASTPKTVTVTVTNASNETIFHHTYTVKPDHMDQTLSLNGDPTEGSIRVEASGYATIEEPYIPQNDPRNPHSDLPPDACTTMDILIVVGENKLDITYSCP